jgi:L-ribulose-5-phosphate 4-epimerase
LPYSLFFACINESIPSVTNLSDTLGEVPCLYSDDLAIKRQLKKMDFKIKALPCMVQRDDMAAIFKVNIIPAFVKNFKSRIKEMDNHGMAFTIYKHGLFVFARTIDECFENLVRVEINARVAMYKKFLKNF